MSSVRLRTYRKVKSNASTKFANAQIQFPVAVSERVGSTVAAMLTINEGNFSVGAVLESLLAAIILFTILTLVRGVGR